MKNPTMDALLLSWIKGNYTFVHKTISEMDAPRAAVTAAYIANGLSVPERVCFIHYLQDQLIPGGSYVDDAETPGTPCAPSPEAVGYEPSGDPHTAHT